MSLHRFFVADPISGEEVRVTGADLHHLRDVLRLHPGEEIALADPSGEQAVARLTEVGSEAAVARVVERLPHAFEPDVMLVQGLSRGPKMDLVMQKATEIGVTRIVPVAMKRSVVKLEGGDAARRTERWRRIVAEAAKQSQRATIPVVDDALGVDGLREVLAGADVVLVPWEEADGRGVGEALREAGAGGGSRVAVVVGPEGGMERSEVEALEELGAVRVTLGPTILRTETAAIVAVALASYELGGLGGTPRE